MTQKEFYKVVHKDLKSAGITKRQQDSDEIISIVINCLTDSLLKGQNVEIQNFGVFNLVFRKMQNFVTKQTIKRWTVTLKTSKSFSRKLNEHLRDETA